MLTNPLKCISSILWTPDIQSFLWSVSFPSQICFASYETLSLQVISLSLKSSLCIYILLSPHPVCLAPQETLKKIRDQGVIKGLRCEGYVLGSCMLSHFSRGMRTHILLVDTLLGKFILFYIAVFPGSSADKRICLQCRRPRFDSWVGKIPWRRKMTIHSSILAWKIPCTEEPGGVQSMGLQRVGHDWATKHK